MAGSPLLVPLHLDVLVHSEQSHNEGSFAWFEVDYGKLASFEDPLPAAFTQEGAPKPGYGVYLHWALPDALTRGDGNNPKGITFGSVPDRWLIGRFNAAGDTWINKFWVIESDFTGDEGSSVFLIRPRLRHLMRCTVLRLAGRLTLRPIKARLQKTAATCRRLVRAMSLSPRSHPSTIMSSPL